MLTAAIRNIRKLDNEETLAGIITLLGVDHHIEFVRVHEEDGLQEPVNDPHHRFGDMQNAYNGYYHAVRVPRFDGEYVVSVLPYAR